MPPADTVCVGVVTGMALPPLNGTVWSPNCDFSLTVDATGMRLDIIYTKVGTLCAATMKWLCCNVAISTVAPWTLDLHGMSLTAFLAGNQLRIYGICNICCPGAGVVEADRVYQHPISSSQGLALYHRAPSNHGCISVSHSPGDGSRCSPGVPQLLWPRVSYPFQVLFNAFACVAFFKFVIFAILEMRYLLVLPCLICYLLLP